MIRFLLALVLMLSLATAAQAHGGTRVIRGFNGDVIIVDDFGNVIARRGPSVVVRSSGFHVAPRGVNPFNQNGGFNRIGRRR